jgi:pimeloyl-ACP methyl ester carboxylesterase
MARSVVLVHGAWHGSWCWERVVPLVREAGVVVIAVDLPSRADPLGDLHGDAAHVRSVLDAAGGDVVLVGHSYGGAVITGAGDHDAVAQLVYLCAFALDTDESCMAAAADESAAAGISHEGRPDLGAAIVVADDRTSTLTSDGAAALLYNRCDAETASWAVSHLTPQPMATLSQAPPAVAWRERLSTYVVCTDDNIVHPDLQRIMARRCSSSIEWPTDHSPFLSTPTVVADLLIDLARG